MKMFIFEGVSELTYNYHSEGGLVVVAENEEQVNEIVKEDEYIKLTPEDWKNVITYEIAGNVEPKYYVFPDAGCC
jgi:hypothetical protein